MSTSLLDARVVVAHPALTVDVPLRVEAGAVLGMAGPNGAGKTTVLRALAGLAPIIDGHITLGGRTLDDPSRDIFVVPRERRVGFVFQEHRLIPHLDALDNVAFGLEARGTRRRAARAAAATWLERVGLADHAHHLPRALSGGQSQRVALARALVTEPDLLLLDEPFAAVDASARSALRAEVASHLAGFGGVTIIVSHDLEDLVALAGSALVLGRGDVVWSGPPVGIPSERGIAAPEPR